MCTRKLIGLGIKNPYPVGFGYILSLDSGINSTKIDPQVSISIPTLNHCDEGFGYLLRLLFWSPQVQLLIVVVGKGLRIKRHEKIDHTIFINW
jgi:hypothetical protein